MERAFHEWLKDQLEPRANVVIGVGDDAAVLDVAGQQVVTTDTIADGTHFLIGEHSLAQIGRKSLAVSLSDIAAMGATPVAATLHWLLPSTFELPQAKQLFGGVQRLASQYGLAIVGGDTNRWEGKLVVGATVIGRLDAGQSAWRLNGASPGDAIFVSGTFGGSLHGHHLDFEPALDLVRALRPLGVVRAATDATDSLARDLGLMAAASGCGAIVDCDDIPLSDAIKQTAATPEQAIASALSDGEDFGLILAVAESDAGQLADSGDSGDSVTRIGTFCQQAGLWTMAVDGTLEKLKATGYDH